MVQVVTHQEEIQALNTDVITVSFGTIYWAQIWLQETQSPFPFLVDQERTAYHAYGLQASVFRSWSIKNLWYYIKAVREGRELLGKRGNPHQLGGDFIIDHQGIVCLAHPSSEPTDRVGLDKILTLLRDLDAMDQN